MLEVALENTVLSTQVQSLDEENAALKARVQSLEISLQCEKREKETLSRQYEVGISELELEHEQELCRARRDISLLLEQLAAKTSGDCLQLCTRMAEPPPNGEDAQPDVSAEHLEKIEDIIKTRVEKGNTFFTIRNAIQQYRAENKLPTVRVRYDWIRKMMQKFENEDLAKKMKDMTVDQEAKIQAMEQEIEMLEERNAALWEKIWAMEANIQALEQDIEMLKKREYALWELAKNATGAEGVDSYTTIGALISVQGKDYVKKYFAEEYADYIERRGRGAWSSTDKADHEDDTDDPEDDADDPEWIPPNEHSEKLDVKVSSCH